MLADMGPDEKWEVAVAKAPKCPKWASVPSQPTSEESTPEDPAIASTSGLAVGVPTPDLPPPVRGVKRSSAGEEGAMVEAILDFVGSRGEMEERKDWRKTHTERILGALLYSVDSAVLLSVSSDSFTEFRKAVVLKLKTVAVLHTRTTAFFK